jgi:dCMP deaminase
MATQAKWGGGVASNGFTLNIRTTAEKWDRRFLQMAQLISTYSKDPSTKVGAVIVAGKVLVSAGYNGLPASMPDKAEYYDNREEKYSRILHGECNALLFAGRSVKGMTCVTWPFSPCDRCCVLLLQAGISRFVFPQLPADKAERWGDSMAKAKGYIEECGAWWTEYPPVVP